MFYGLVRLVGRVAQSSDDEQLDVSEQGERRIEEFGHVREVSYVADAVTEDGQFAVHDAQGSHFERTELQAVAFLNLLQVQLRNAWISMVHEAVG